MTRLVAELEAAPEWVSGKENLLPLWRTHDFSPIVPLFIVGGGPQGHVTFLSSDVSPDLANDKQSALRRFPGYTRLAMTTAEHFLDRYLDPIAEALTPQVAQRILDLRPDPEVLARVAQLAEKSNEGTLNEEERDEYRALADAGTLIALFKAKARRTLSEQSS